jgi:hypothetical protein
LFNTGDNFTLRCNAKWFLFICISEASGSISSGSATM